MDDLNRLRKLAGVKLTESVQAVPPAGGLEIGAKVFPRWSQGGEPMEIVGKTNSGKVVVLDDFGNKGLMSLDDLVPATVHEEIGNDAIDMAQQEIDFDSGSQPFEEDIEKPAQVVSCNQDNPASCRDACAMEESVGNDVMEFGSSKEAYDAVQTGQCPRGSIFTVPSERIVGIADTWPVAFTKEYGQLHQFKDGMSTEEKAQALSVSPEVILKAEQMANEMDGKVDEAYDLNNGYYDRKVLDGEDYFPTGADSPVVDKVGPSGARQGDNPEQKKMEVAEAHKELVYSYRKFLKESATKK